MPYGQYRVITIDDTQVPEALTSFPVLLVGTFAYLKTVANGGKVTSNSGYDIQIFLNADATGLLEYELEKYDPTTGEIALWFKHDFLAPADFTVYLLYGNASITTNQSTPANVWDSNFVLVAHLADNAANSNVNDSTSNNTDGTCTANTSSISATGVIGKGLNLGGSQIINYGDILDTLWGLGTSFTFEAWIKTASSIGNSKAGIITKAADSVKGPIFSVRFDTLYYEGYDGSNNPAVFGGVTIVVGDWTYVSMSRNGVSHIGTFVINSVSSTFTDNTGDMSSSHALIIGGDTAVANGILFPGSLDEVRISSIVRSVNWLKTCQANQKPDSTFYSIGTEIPFGGGSSILHMKKTGSKLGTKVGSRQIYAS